MDCVICRYGEIALKGRNRNLFEKQLVSNIKDCLSRNKISGVVKRERGRIFVFSEDVKALSFIKDVFGLVSISSAVITKLDVELIKDKVLEYVKNISGKISTFRVTSKRMEKRFEKTSHEMDIILGDLIHDSLDIKVDLHNPDLNLCVEILDNAYIFHEKIDCFGGLPIGMGGNVVCIIEDENDILAAWLMMKRGCHVFPVSYKKTSISMLERFSYGTKIQLKTVKDIEDINSYIEINDCRALVVGDVLEDFNPKKYEGVQAILLTPLVGYDAESVQELLKSLK